MEINEPLDSEIHALKMTPASRAYLLEAAKWGRFLSIVGFVILGLIGIMFLFMGGTMMSLGAGVGMQEMGFLVFLNIVLTFLLMFLPNYYLFNFSTRVITAINESSSLDLAEGLKNLKSLLKYWGILISILLAIYAIIFLFIGGAAMTTF